MLQIMTGAAESNRRPASSRAVLKRSVLLYTLLRIGESLGEEKKKALVGDGLFLMSPNLFHKLSEIF